VQFNAVWADGHSEQLEVQVVAKAVSLGHDESADEQAPQVSAQPKPDTRPPSLDLFNDNVKTLDRHLGGVASSQREGVTVIDKEAARYVAPTPAPSGWALLAELAITVGTAGVAAVVGKYVSNKLTAVMTDNAVHSVASSATHAAGHAVSSSAGHAVATSVEHGAAHASTAGAHAAGGAIHYAAEGLGTGIEDALKESLQGKLKTKEAPEAIERDDEGALSKDAQIQFFASQRGALLAAEEVVADSMDRFIAPIRDLAKSDPGTAIKIVAAIQGGFDAGREVGQKQQMAATAVQWIDFVAQGRHGSKTVGRQTVTNLDNLRKPQQVYADNAIAANNGKGVLEIIVGVSEDLNVLVATARLDGVARLVGDRLMKQNLRTAGIPIRLRTGYKDVITIDETGEVRTAGPRQYEENTPGEGDAGGEAQNIRGAKRIVDRVFAKTLSQWGLSHIASDDASR